VSSRNAAGHAKKIFVWPGGLRYLEGEAAGVDAVDGWPQVLSRLFEKG
jgi:hypothetical protein